MMNEEFLENFKVAYATILNKICQDWIQDEDSSNNHFQTCIKKEEDFEFMKIIYQPGKIIDNFVEFGNVLLCVKKDVSITKLEKEGMRKVIKQVNQMLMDDYFEFRKKTGDKWYRKLSKVPTFEEVLDITSPWKEIKKNTWKLTFRLNDDIQGKGSFGWVPKSICEFLDDFNEEWYDELIEKFSE